MTDITTEPTSTGHPFVVIEQVPDGNADGGFDLKVRAGGGIEDGDHIATLLLLVVEQITGVSASLYAQEIEIARRVARGGRLFPDSDDDED